MLKHLGRRCSILAIISFACQVVGVAALGGFLVALYGYLKAHSGEAPTNEYMAIFVEWPFWVILILVFLLGMLGATLMYMGEWLTIRIARILQVKYTAIATRSILINGVFDEILKQYPSSDPKRFIAISSRYAAFSTRRFVALVSPILAILGGFYSLWLLSWQSTMVLSFLCGASIIPFYLINLKAARLQRVFHDTGGAISRRCNVLIKRICSSKQLPDLDMLESDISDDELSRDELDSLYGRILVIRTSNFLNVSFMVIAICIIVATTVLYFEGEDWALLLSYLVVLRVTATGIRQLSGIVVTISRYFPEVEKLQIATSMVGEMKEITLDSSWIDSLSTELEDDELDDI